MNPDEIKALAEVIHKVPGVKGIDLKDVRKLAEMLSELPDVGSIEVKGFLGTGVIVTRTAQHTVMAAPVAAPQFMPAPATISSQPTAVELPVEAAKPLTQLKDIKSPMVGTFYKSPEPGADPYIKVGSRVAGGQTVCIIEAMKIMNEIEAEFGGVVREVCVEDSQPVEFGQVLFRVDPNG
ncbi:MAG: acetyl-CoA carboxylase biotin carboxyl carrier protein [Gemmatimonadota bacterium]